MPNPLQLHILPQPDDTTCGPTCLHAVYRYFSDTIDLEEVVTSTGKLPDGGTLGVLLGHHALQRGYSATIYTYNLNVFDPTWFRPNGPDLRERLLRQLELKPSRKLQTATRAYHRFLELGGTLKMEDLTESLFRRYLDRRVPILTGLSSTYLYQNMREFGPNDDPDDVRGKPMGHFVILCGYDGKTHTVDVADPLEPNPVAESRYYRVGIERLLGAIFLGTLTYDGNLLTLEPRKESSK